MKWIKNKILEFICLFVHGFIQDKHKMEKPYSPFKCEKCNRLWEL